MDLSYNETQLMFRDSLRRFFSDCYDFEKRQKILLSGEGWSREVWRALADDLGVLGACFEEGQGGLGFGAVETAIIMEEIGRVLALEPYLPTVVLCGGILRRVGGPVADKAIEALIAGNSICAFAHAERQARYDIANVAVTASREGGGYVLNGQKVLTLAAPIADRLIVSAHTNGAQTSQGGISLFMLDPCGDGIDMRSYKTVDGGRAADISFENVTVDEDARLGEEGAALETIEAAIDEAVAGLCAEAAGAMRVMYESSVEFVKERRQFGRSISDFQAIQHRIADMLIEVEQADAAALQAVLQLSAPPQERKRAVSSAKALINEAARFVAHNAIQLHGAIGTTDELALGHYFKRLTAIETLFGSTDHHLRRYDQNTVQ
ncbi:acyl-CoA dehydrogenase family protein [Marinicaulis aureus]|uniref:Acyl-CoA dehydrogenase family protein n=1 Tax=Hyphococcus aureus TaxID=2666033 RepID=A0ABW1KYA1_9PROT